MMEQLITLPSDLEPSEKWPSPWRVILTWTHPSFLSDRRNYQADLQQFSGCMDRQTHTHTHTHTHGTGRPLVWKTWKCQGICSCQGNVGDFTKSQGNVVEKILSGKRWLEPFIVSCIFVPIQVFSSSTGMIWVTHLTSRGEVPRTVREMSGEFHIVWTPESGHAGGRLSWLLVSFSLHVKYTLSYRIVSSWW